MAVDQLLASANPRRLAFKKLDTESPFLISSLNKALMCSPESLWRHVARCGVAVLFTLYIGFLKSTPIDVGEG
jgi:hypothetical protein